MLRILLSGLTLLAAGALPARPPVEASLVEVAVIDRDSGRRLTPALHQGQRWIAGTPGHRYSVRLTNTGPDRVLVVLSVDGINAVTGETANPAQTGYVLGPWQSTDIHGWRKSLDDVAQFVFTDLSDSYAARTGRPDDIGVIGVAVFEEARRYRRDVPATAPIARERGEAKASAADDPHQQSIGTGHGQRERSPVARTDFVRASRMPAQLTELRYDDAASLIARGVPVARPPFAQRRPRAFPDGFVADPP